MALSRKYLRELGIESDKIDLIIDAHMETVEGLKEERDTFKAEAEKVPSLTEQLEIAKGAEEWKVKYDKLNGQFETYKAEQREKETVRAKDKAYRDLLKSAGVTEKRIDTIMKVTDISAFNLTENGSLVDAEKITEDVKSEWSDFIQTTETQGAETQKPPSNAGKAVYTHDDIAKMTQEEINANWDAIKASL